MTGGRNRSPHNFKDQEITDLRKIHYCLAKGNYTSIIFANKNKIVAKCLKSFAKTLPPGLFFRTDKSVLINLNFLEAFNDKFVIMKSGVELKLSRRQRGPLKKELKRRNLLL